MTVNAVNALPLAEPAWATRSRAAVSKDRPRIGVIYPSGWGNLGDEAILQATFDGLRKRWPNASLHAFTLHPERTAANHHVDADYLTGVNRPHFGSPRERAPLPLRMTRAVARRTTGIPIVGRFTALAEALTAAVIYEVGSMRRAWKRSRRGWAGILPRFWTLWMSSGG